MRRADLMNDLSGAIPLFASGAANETSGSISADIQGETE